MPVGGTHAAAHGSSLTPTREAIPSRMSAEAITTPTRTTSRVRVQARRACAADAAPPSRPSAVSRATATCSDDPATARIVNVDRSAASAP